MSARRSDFVIGAEAPGWLLVLFYLFHLAMASAATLVFASDLLDPLDRATGGLLNATFQANLVLLIVGVGVVLLGLGRLAPSDLGLSLQKVPAALVMTAAIWLITQAILMLASLAATGSLALHPWWNQRGTTVVLGLLLGQLLGNALFEEIGYRGFLLPQLHHKLGRLLSSKSKRALLAAVGVSQALFALMHIPNRLANGADLASLPTALLMPFLLGLLFALVYLRTENLFLAVGVHALFNTPTAIFTGSVVEPWMVILGATLLLLAIWRRISVFARSGNSLSGRPAPAPGSPGSVGAEHAG